MFLILVADYGDGFPVDSSLCIYLIFLLYPRQVVRLGFLILCGWRAVGHRPDGLRLVAFSMVPGGIHPGHEGFFLYDIRKKKKKKAFRWIPISVLIEYSTSTNYHDWLCVNWFGFFSTLFTFLLLPSSLYNLQNFTWSTVVCFSFSLSYVFEIYKESNSYILEHSRRIVVSLCWKVEPFSSPEKKSEHIFLFFST